MDHIRFVPAPDSYRPPNDMTPEQHAADFARHVENAIDDLERSEIGFAGLLICPFFANEGFPDLPENWLDPTVKAVKNAGGLLIADEVQPGFGRIGSHMWGHQYQGFTPTSSHWENPWVTAILLRQLSQRMISFRHSAHPSDTSIHLVATLYPWPQRTRIGCY